MASSSRKRSVHPNDNSYEEILRTWYEEDDNDSITSESEVSEADQEYEQPAVYKDSSDEYSENSWSSDDMNLNQNNSTIETAGTSFISRNNFEWRSTPPLQGRTKIHNLYRFTAGPKVRNEMLSPKNAWDKFVTAEMVEEIIICTNREANRILEAKGKVWPKIEKDEMNAFFGLLLLAGVEKNWDTPVRELFLDKSSNPLYKATMAVNRFENIRRFIRFDDRRTRSTRLETDKFTYVRYVWELFVKQCRTVMVPELDVTIDEQLLAFRGRCNFIQYMPSKPAKYGIKFFGFVKVKQDMQLMGRYT